MLNAGAVDQLERTVAMGIWDESTTQLARMSNFVSALKLSLLTAPLFMSDYSVANRSPRVQERKKIVQSRPVPLLSEGANVKTQGSIAHRRCYIEVWLLAREMTFVD